MLQAIIFWILFGALAGWLASLVMGADARMGATENIIVGIIGAVIGGFIMSSVGGGSVSGFNLYSILVAVGGAVVLIFLVRMFRRA
ncbi:MAG TPA: GlsB/YeaQ/YmgE family stress response membrane protein [Anaerolineales bacterium]|nr:GlsB/YeaQ/YmgE family stress response membrane protein [Anaerolineales bacterium]